MALYVADIFIKIDNTAAPANFKNDLLQVCVEESLHLPGMFTLVVNNPYAPGDSQTTAWQHKDLLKIGKKIEIGFQPSTTTDRNNTATGQTNSATASYILVGEITAIETHFTNSSQAPILVRGYDISHRLHRGKHNRSFQDIKDSDLVTQIAGEAGITLGTITATTQINSYLFQQNQTNMEFLRDRAARIGYELYVRDGQLYFTQPTAGSQLQLIWMQDLTSFRVRVSTAEQVNSVEVRSWDYINKQPIAETVSYPADNTTTDGVITNLSKVGNGRDKLSSFTPAITASNAILVDRPVNDNQEAQTIAKALFDELEGEFIYADAKAVGDPKIRVGKVVTLSNMGDYDGDYYITETRHIYYQGEYYTEFCVRGLRGGNLLQILRAGDRLKPSQTMLVGIVTDNQDPQDLGRVRVKFPTLTEQHASSWARVVGVGAGKNRGWYCLPEINDEVLVAFEHGDINRPYIIGNVWNGQDKPPEVINQTVPSSGTNQGKVRLRTFKTPTGHSLQFVESDLNASKAGIYLNTASGNHIELNDSDKSIAIKTANNSHILLDDSNQRIEIKTPGGHSYSLDDKTNSIEIDSSGTVNIKAASNITLNPTGFVNVSPLLKCTALTTGSLTIDPLTSAAVDVLTQIKNLQQDVAQLKTDLQSNTTQDTRRNTRLGTVETNLGTVQTDLGTVQTDLGTVETDLGTVQTDLGTVQTNLGKNITEDIQQAKKIADLEKKLPPNSNTGTGGGTGGTGGGTGGTSGTDPNAGTGGTP